MTTDPTPETVAGSPDPRPSAQPQPSRRLRLLRYLSPYAAGDELPAAAVSDPEWLVRDGYAEWTTGGPTDAVVPVGPAEGADRGGQRQVVGE